MTITIDNKEYDLDKLSDEAKAQIVSIQFVDAELQRVNAQAQRKRGQIPLKTQIYAASSSFCII